jgi:hypothetical protein
MPSLLARKRAGAAAAVGVTAAQFQAYRSRTFRLAPRLRLRSVDQAVRFVDERGFVYFWPIKGVDLPSLWVAVAGDRPVADEHDDAGHVTWGWKDSLLGARRWYYAKLLRGKATMVSLAVMPYFYALSDNFGGADDYLLEYEAGRLSQESKLIFEMLKERGPLDTVALRRETRLTSREANSRFERALTELQAGLKILPIGVAKAGAWRYAFIYELADRHYPDLAEQARPITRRQAREHLADLYLQSVGAAREAQVASLFRWKPADAAAACQALAACGRAQRLSTLAGQAGDWWATPGLSRRSA